MWLVPGHEVLSEEMKSVMDKYTRVKTAQGKCCWPRRVQRRQSIPRCSTRCTSSRAQRRDSLLHDALLDCSEPPFSGVQVHILLDTDLMISLFSDSLLFEGRDRHLSIGFSFQFHKL